MQMPRRRLLTAIPLCCALASVCGALAWAAPLAQAAPTWQSPLTISAPFAAPVGIEPVLSLGGAGDVAAAWWENGNIVAAVRPADASTFAQQAISTPGDQSVWPSVAVSASGAVAVAWIDETAAQYEVAIRAPGATAFSAPIQAGPTGNIRPQETTVAIDDIGDVLLGEIRESGANEESAYAWQPAGGAIAVMPASAPASNVGLPAVALDGVGDAVIGWDDNAGSAHTIARALTRTAGGAFGPAQTLTAGADYAFAVKVAIGGGGQAAVVWQAGLPAPPYRVEASSSAGPADLLTVPQTLSPPGGNSEHPAIGVGGNGEAVAAWEQSGATGPEALASAMAGGSFGAAGSLGEAQAGDPEVASDGAGDALIVWGANLPEGGEGVEAVTRTASGTLAPEQVLSEAGEKIDYTLSSNVPAASAGMDAAGDAVVGWEQGSEHTLRARLYGEAPGSGGGGSLTPILTPILTHFVRYDPPPGGCVVPRLRGLSAAAARRRLLAARCALGKVTVARRYRHARRLVVAAQGVRPGRQVGRGTKVALTLKPGPPRHKQHRR
jgi:hypothetical protein